MKGRMDFKIKDFKNEPQIQIYSSSAVLASLLQTTSLHFFPFNIFIIFIIYFLPFSSDFLSDFFKPPLSCVLLLSQLYFLFIVFFSFVRKMFHYFSVQTQRYSAPCRRKQ